MFHCPEGVWVIEQRAIILSATLRSPTVVYIHPFPPKRAIFLEGRRRLAKSRKMGHFQAQFRDILSYLFSAVSRIIYPCCYHCRFLPVTTAKQDINTRVITDGNDTILRQECEYKTNPKSSSLRLRELTLGSADLLRPGVKPVFFFYSSAQEHCTTPLQKEGFGTHPVEVYFYLTIYELNCPQET